MLARSCVSFSVRVIEDILNNQKNDHKSEKLCVMILYREPVKVEVWNPGSKLKSLRV